MRLIYARALSQPLVQWQLQQWTSGLRYQGSKDRSPYSREGANGPVCVCVCILRACCVCTEMTEMGARRRTAGVGCACGDSTRRRGEVSLRFFGDSGEHEGGEGVENEGEEDRDDAVLVHSQQARRSRCFRRSKLNHKRVNKTLGALPRATLTSILHLIKTDLEALGASFGVRLPAPPPPTASPLTGRVDGIASERSQSSMRYS